jgi:hypothetical protein
VVSSSLRVAGKFLPAIEPMMESGSWNQDQFPENKLLAQGITQDFFPPTKAFLPSELRTIIETSGMKILRLGGLGSLSGLCRPGTAQRILEQEPLLEEFLDLCERFDKEIMSDGPGTQERAGLIAAGKKS